MRDQAKLKDGLRHEHRSPPKSIEYDFVELESDDLKRPQEEFNWDEDRAEGD